MSKQEINDQVKVIEEDVVIDKIKTYPLKLVITVNTNKAMFLDDPKLPLMIERLKKATAEFMQPNVFGNMLEATDKFKEKAEFSDKWFKPIISTTSAELGSNNGYLHIHSIITTTSYCMVSVKGPMLGKYKAVIKSHYMKHFPELKGMYVDIKSYPTEQGLQDYISKQAL